MSRRISPLIASLPPLFCLCLQFTNATFLDTIGDTLRPGQSLNTSENMESPNGRFRLGFFYQENSSKYHVGIWFTCIYDHNTVWVANREDPFPNSSAVLTFNPDGNLVISDGGLLHMLTNTSRSRGNDTYARLLDTGNLVLTNRASDTLWQSFDYPTDTLLPGMKIKDAKTGWSLTSWRSGEDPAPGLFSLHLGSRKELIIIRNGSQVPYWTSPLIGRLADIFVIDGDYIFYTDSNNYPSEFRRVALNVSGELLLQTCSDTIKLSGSTNGTVRGNNQLRKIGIPSTSSIAVVVTLGLCVYYVRRKLRRKGPSGEDLLLLELGTTQKANNSEHGDSRKREVQMPLFSFASVSAATNNFSATNKLGEGGFGYVYRGILLKGDEVAVKRLSKRSMQGWEELRNETMLIAKLQHKNLVRLLGCCIERDEKILVYEYMSNKSLDFFLFADQEKRRLLDWRTRVRIIEGITQGLLYLHQYSRLKIIHRDLKPSNILLDIDMNPKISDFGMARIFGGNESQANTNRIVGTYGYMSPEYALEGIFSIKSDVFSFGVLLLEIVSGKKNTGFYRSDCLHLLGYAWKLWTSDRGWDLVDPLLVDISSAQMVLRYVNIALFCVQEHAEDRPTMSDVVAMLSNESAILPYPKEPAFLNVRSISQANPVNNMPEICSVNGATVSIMKGR